MNSLHEVPPPPAQRSWWRVLAVLSIVFAAGAGLWWSASGQSAVTSTVPVSRSRLDPRLPIDTSGYSRIAHAARWRPEATLEEIRQLSDAAPEKMFSMLKQQSASFENRLEFQIEPESLKACLHMAQGEPKKAYELLQDLRLRVEKYNPGIKRGVLSTLMYFQGVAALRRGENENCIMCRGESSCIMPIRPSAVHKNPDGSRLAIHHFTEYLEEFPDDLEARWLLNLAHMTLGEYPQKVDPRFAISLAAYQSPEADIGRFRDVGHLVGVNRFNQAGGVIMDDFDNDGLLDLAVTAFDPRQPLGFYRNLGDGRFQESAEEAGVLDQLGGLVCIQTDYNNDGLLDIYIPRGAWVPHAIRPTLLRNDGNCGFTDVTAEAGLLHAVNSNAAQWADYDNDGWLDLFVCCERQAHRLYHNLRDGTFEEVGTEAGVAMDGQSFGKGCTWIDYDNDNYPDLFINYLNGMGQLHHNNRDGTFTNVTMTMGIDGPYNGFSCWAWDFNNDGWLDIFATCYERSLKDVVKGIIGEPHELHSNKLYLNQQGKGFKDVTREAGLDMVFATMGSNYGDFDNDGWLDFYLGTGEPNFSTLIPNRMFKNLAGQRFAEVTGSAGVGHLQKGHGIACGDWDRDGDIDIFSQLGGAVNGDKFHNVLYQNPGHGHSSISVKLVGDQSNRAALGARIKVVTDGKKTLTVHRHITPGSSFGSSPLEQTIGLATAQRIATLEIHWPTSGTTQTFHNLAVNQAIEVTEFVKEYKTLTRNPVALPE